MQNDPANYDEDACLTNYIWDNYASLLTHAEQLAAKTLRVQIKQPDAVGHSQLTSELLLPPSPEIEQLLARGYKEFRRDTAARVLRDHIDDVQINRCPSCNRIVRTPMAQQCLWCGCDWH